MKKHIPLINNSLKISLEFSFDNKNIENFENDMENYLGNENYFTALNSGTSGIHLALILLGVKENDEVICQTFTFAASAFPILYLKAIPVFVDSEKLTWNMCPEKLEIAIKNRIQNGKKPKAIIVVHSYGMPAMMDEILAVSKKYKIPLIEDAAGALGSTYKNKKCGTFGDFGVFSFNNNKIISTFGGGGLVCKSKKIKEKAVFLATQSKEKSAYYKHYNLGYNYRMSPVSAELGRIHLGFLPDVMKSKKEIQLFYNKLFSDIKFIEYQNRSNKFFNPNNWLFSILINKSDNGINNTKIKNHLKNNNIDSRFLWKPLHLQPVFKDYLFFGEQVAEELFQKGLSLPSGSYQKVDLKRIYTSIKKIL